ncbi:hypothetical protein C8R47DRAFT_1303298 [Mycena vitilis]|nr:hypothetical protein C8R47DRAFT_1303298 [Mycena vitilis]
MDTPDTPLICQTSRSAIEEMEVDTASTTTVAASSVVSVNSSATDPDTVASSAIVASTPEEKAFVSGLPLSDYTYKKTYTKTRNLSGAFDGRLAAVVQARGDLYLITTHANYIPALPPSEIHDVVLRKDLRYGLDDPSTSPQYYSDLYCHLAVTPTKANSRRAYSILWWDPAPSDLALCSSRNTKTLTPLLGRLSLERRHTFSGLVSQLQANYGAYVKHAGEQNVPGPMRLLVKSMGLGLERLVSLLWTFEHLALMARNLQRTCLELIAMIDYMQFYKPVMEMPHTAAPPEPSPSLLGAFTTNPKIAQRFWAAGIPYWFMRPASAYLGQNILEVIDSLPAPSVQVERHPVHNAICQATHQTDDKVEAINKVSRSVEWYHDPFNAPEPSISSERDGSSSGRASAQGGTSYSSGDGGRGRASDQASTSGSYRGSSHRGGGGGRGSGGQGGSGRGGGGGRDGRKYSPYKADPPATAMHVHPGRNKFQPLAGRPEMPGLIPSWQKGLSAVNQKVAPTHNPRRADKRYVFPEPALLASPDDRKARQLRLHHWCMMRDAFLYRLLHAEPGSLALISQEWRDVLAGNIKSTSGKGVKSALRRGLIDELLSPALNACGIESQDAIPADRDTIPPISDKEAKEIIWEIAETSFRMELVSLDRRASGFDRRKECSRCFPERMLFDIPIELSQRGFADSQVIRRHPYVVRLANLMLIWPDAPRSLRDAQLELERAWSEPEMRKLEDNVAAFYCQSFYDYFGRPPVVPMRIEHELHN